jgi:hypothetical protein
LTKELKLKKRCLSRTSSCNGFESRRVFWQDHGVAFYNSLSQIELPLFMFVFVSHLKRTFGPRVRAILVVLKYLINLNYFLLYVLESKFAYHL